MIDASLVDRVKSAINALHPSARLKKIDVYGVSDNELLEINNKHLQHNYYTDIITKQIINASRVLSAVTSFSVQPNKAIVGANAFAHESGIHQDGMLKHNKTYEIMEPESIGLSKSKLVLGKHSGRHAFKEKLSEMGYNLGDNYINEAFNRFWIKR